MGRGEGAESPTPVRKDRIKPGLDRINNNNNNNNNNSNIPFICHIEESTELKGYKLQLKLLLL